MVPKWNQTSIKVRKVQITPENLVRKPWYQEEGTRTEVLEPVLWNFSTETGTEPKNQYCPFVQILKFSNPITVVNLLMQE